MTTKRIRNANNGNGAVEILDDGTVRISDKTDKTKKLEFDLSLLPTGSTSTIKPAANVPLVGMLPIGAIIAIMPHMSGAYNCTSTTAADVNGFVVCGGQVISDTNSPMNGQTVPNLNNDVFLSGTSSTTGVSGGANTKDLSHTHSVTSNVAVANHTSHTHSVTSNVTVSNHASHTHSVTSNVTVGDHTVTNNAVNSLAGGSHTHSIPAHFHDFTGSGNTAALASSLGISGSAPSLGGTTTFPVSNHTHGLDAYATVEGTGTTLRIARRSVSPSYTSDVTASVSFSGESNASGWAANVYGTASATTSGTGTVTISGGSYSLTGSNSVTGSIGYKPATSPVNGNAAVTSGAENAHTHSVTSNVTVNSHSVTNNAVTSGNESATLSHSVTNNAVTSGNESATLSHSVTNNAVTSGSALSSSFDIRPKYITCKYIMRIV